MTQQQSQFTASVWPEAGGFVAQCRELDVASQGPTVEEALANLREAVALHCEPPTATSLPQIYSFGVEICAA